VLRGDAARPCGATSGSESRGGRRFAGSSRHPGAGSEARADTVNQAPSAAGDDGAATCSSESRLALSTNNDVPEAGAGTGGGRADAASRSSRSSRCSRSSRSSRSRCIIIISSSSSSIIIRRRRRRRRSSSSSSSSSSRSSSSSSSSSSNRRRRRSSSSNSSSSRRSEPSEERHELHQGRICLQGRIASAAAKDSNRSDQFDR